MAESALAARNVRPVTWGPSARLETVPGQRSARAAHSSALVAAAAVARRHLAASGHLSGARGAAIRHRSQNGSGLVIATDTSSSARRSRAGAPRAHRFVLAAIRAAGWTAPECYALSCSRTSRRGDQGYMIGYVVRRAAPSRPSASLVPYGAVTIVWRLCTADRYGAAVQAVIDPSTSAELNASRRERFRSCPGAVVRTGAGCTVRGKSTAFWQGSGRGYSRSRSRSPCGSAPAGKSRASGTG